MAEELLYTRLPQRYIRVLSIKAASSLDARICSDMSTIDLDDIHRIQFSALSYVWGDAGMEGLYINCGGIKVSILPNAESALRHLRHKLGACTIWIDAICINQKDEEEKELQIPLMGEIYAKSQFVYIWLGADTTQTRKAMEYLRYPPFLQHFSSTDPESCEEPREKFWAALVAYFIQSFKYKKTMFPSQSGDGRSTSDEDERDIMHVTFQDLTSLLKTSWLERMWTYQEILLASNPVIVCGLDHLEWSTFSCAVAFLEHTECFQRATGSRFQPLITWTKLALAREYIRSIDEHAPNNGDTPIKDQPEFYLRSYISFLNSMIEWEKGLIYVAITLPILIISGIIAITGVINLAQWGETESNLIFVSDYNQRISSMVSSILSSDYGLSVTPSQSHRERVPIATVPASQVTAFISPGQKTHVVTSVLDLIPEIRRSSVFRLEIINSAIHAMSTAVVSIADSCQHNCMPQTRADGCFASCVAGATAMPTLREVSFQEADLRGHHTRGYYMSMFLRVAISALVVCVTCALILGLKAFRSQARMKLGDRPSGSEVDLIDAILYRKAWRDHDKAFALRSVLQLLSATPIPSPDYSQSLDETYADLNVQIYHILGFGSLLTVASVIPLADHPCWMVDWSKKPDLFWLSASSPYHRIQAQPRIYGASKSILDYGNTVKCKACIRCYIHDFLKFQQIEGLYDMTAHKENLLSGIRMAKSTAHIPKHADKWMMHLRELIGIAAPLTQKAQISRWVQFLYKHRGDPEAAFKLLTRNDKLLETHFAICKQFSQPKRKLFWYVSYLQRRSTRVGRKLNVSEWYSYALGICRDSVQINDALIEVSGASTPLIVAMPGHYNSDLRLRVRSMSPAIMREGRLLGEDRVLTFA